MGKIRIVTDSSAVFEDSSVISSYGITVVPLHVEMGGKHYKDSVDIDAEEVLHRMQHNNEHLKVTAPQVEAFEDVYRTLGRQTDAIIVLVNSQQFTQTFASAQSARSKKLS